MKTAALNSAPELRRRLVRIYSKELESYPNRDKDQTRAIDALEARYGDDCLLSGMISGGSFL